MLCWNSSYYRTSMISGHALHLSQDQTLWGRMRRTSKLCPWGNSILCTEVPWLSSKSQWLQLSSSGVWHPVGMGHISYSNLDAHEVSHLEPKGGAANCHGQVAEDRCFRSCPPMPCPRIFQLPILFPQKTGDIHPVIDLITLKDHLVVPHFQMEKTGNEVLHQESRIDQ